MIINKKNVRKNKALKAAQRADKKAGRDRRADRGSVLKKNIEKVVTLSSEELIGTAAGGGNALPEAVSAKELIPAAEGAGLTGMSGSGFPVSKKLAAFLASDVRAKVIIINGVECEPGLLHDAWLMRNRAEEINRAAMVLKKALSPARIILATRGRAEYSAQLTAGLEHIKVPFKYPMGEEHVLIRQLLGKKLEKAVIPAQLGILVINVQTVWQLGRILSGRYDGSHLVTLANLKTGEARVAFVSSETGINAALSEAFGNCSGNYYVGGGIVSAEKAAASAVFPKTASFAAIYGEVTITNDNPCKKCGGCTKKCPMGISVKDIVLAKQKTPDADVTAFGSEACIGCGTCTYFCMAGKDPMAYVSGK